MHPLAPVLSRPCTGRCSSKQSRWRVGLHAHFDLARGGSSLAKQKLLHENGESSTNKLVKSQTAHVPGARVRVDVRTSGVAVKNRNDVAGRELK
jgi:hypothetical protein